MTRIGTGRVRSAPSPIATTLVWAALAGMGAIVVVAVSLGDDGAGCNEHCRSNGGRRRLR